MRRKEREISNITEIESIISGADVCRVAFANGDTPYIVTMNFGYSGGKNPELFFHCATTGRKIDMMKENNYVCFEFDTGHEIYKGEKGCDWGMKFSSVVGYGRLYVVEEDTERRAGLGHIMNHYGGSGLYLYDDKVLARTMILRLDISEMTGKSKQN
jgi:nitroimidazol reductase NimA-like FMN-containing flavoprotein (pyridoxamine 5'-phosphate oxidase superfamily)